MKHDDVLAVVVSYNGGHKTTETVRHLREVVSKILVVDNGSSLDNIEPLERLNSSDIEIIKLHDNRGIGFALNVGVKYALRNGFKWLLTMDQDSLVMPDFLDAYKCYIGKNPSASSLSPSVSLFQGSIGGANEGQVDYCITSGNLLRVELFSRVGFFNENLFIDGVDFEFCLRLRLHGIKIFMVPSAILMHELGAPHKKAGWISRFYSNHSPLRRYYMSRNLVFLIANYFFVFPKFVAKLFISHVLMFIAIIIYECGGWQSIRYMAKGVSDGVAGRYGNYQGCNQDQGIVNEQ